jgi:hypothetical protein
MDEHPIDTSMHKCLTLKTFYDEHFMKQSMGQSSRTVKVEQNENPISRKTGIVVDL